MAIGFLHGLAGTGAIVLPLLVALPTQVEAALGLAVFAWSSASGTWGSVSRLGQPSRPLAV